MQIDLFATGTEAHFSRFEVVPAVNADIKLSRSWLAPSEAGALYHYFSHAVAWEQPTITIAGQPQQTPRLQAWFGDSGTTYGYSRQSFEPLPWVPKLLLLKTKIEVACGATFNSVLINWYRNGQDSVGWHADNEPELGQQPVIASLSLGESRRFLIRPNHHPVLPKKSGWAPKRGKSTGLDLHSGDLLLMSGQTQRSHQHSVPKTQRSIGGRINLTFRKVLGGCSQ